MLAEDLVVIVPTRGRPQAVIPLIQAWEETGSKALLHFCLDDDDPQLDAYHEAIDANLTPEGISVGVAPRLRLAGTLNLVAPLFAMREYEAVGFMGDDHRPRTPGWDARFAECLSGGAGMVYGNDLLMGEKMPTAVFMTADIITTLGYMCPPGLVHLCLDLVWKDWGEGMGRITYLDDVIIEHMHPANGKAKLDQGYVEVNSQDQVRHDTQAYVDYRDGGAMAEDIEKLRTLL